MEHKHVRSPHTRTFVHQTKQALDLSDVDTITQSGKLGKSEKEKE